MILFFGSGRGGCLPVVLLGVGVVLLLSMADGGAGSVLLLPLLLVGMFLLLPLLAFRSLFRGLTGGGGRGHYTGDRRWQGHPSPAPEVLAGHRQQPVDPADVQSVVARLAHDVRTLQPGDDQIARQALADASERYATASSQLERARSQDQLRTAWLAAAEGLHATRLVRQRLGVDPGPAPALPPSSGPQLQQHARLVVDGREHVGAPAYEPGYPHWFPGGQVGGRYVPGGWYADAFWPGSLVLGVLSGWALGSLLSGAAYGAFGLPYDQSGWGDGGWGDVGGGSFGEGGDWGDVGGGSFGDGGGWGDVGGGDFGGDFGGDW